MTVLFYQEEAGCLPLSLRGGGSEWALINLVFRIVLAPNKKAVMVTARRYK